MIRGANVDAKGRNGNTPLHLAALMGFAELTEELLKWGADPNMVNGNGQLPLELALVKGLERDDNRTSQFSRVAQIIIKEMEPARYIVYQCLIMITSLLNYRVRDTFITTQDNHRKIDFQEVLFKEGMQV